MAAVSGGEPLPVKPISSDTAGTDLVASSLDGLKLESDSSELKRWGFPLTDLYKLALKFYKGECQG